MEARTSRKAQSDDYFMASSSLKSDRLKEFTFAWLEVVEGKKPESVDYVIHASNQAAAVPSFAVEHYENGLLQGYEPSKQRIAELAVMPEELRARIVNAQMASHAVSQAEAKPARAAMPG